MSKQTMEKWPLMSESGNTSYKPSARLRRRDVLIMLTVALEGLSPKHMIHVA